MNKSFMDKSDLKDALRLKQKKNELVMAKSQNKRNKKNNKFKKKDEDFIKKSTKPITMEKNALKIFKEVVKNLTYKNTYHYTEYVLPFTYEFRATSPDDCYYFKFGDGIASLKKYDADTSENQFKFNCIGFCFLLPRLQELCNECGIEMKIKNERLVFSIEKILEELKDDIKK